MHFRFFEYLVVGSASGTYPEFRFGGMETFNEKLLNKDFWKIYIKCATYFINFQKQFLKC